MTQPRLIYISQGNIPCKWTHSIQMMKTAEAFGQVVPKFSLLTRGRIQDAFKSNQKIFAYYGIKHPFPIIRFPLTFTWNDEHALNESYPAFMNLSILYAKLQRDPLVYTRHSVVAYKACQWGLRTIMESHTGTDTGGFYYQKLIKDHPNLLGFVLNSISIKRSYEQEGVPLKKLFVQGNGVDTEFFRVNEEKHTLREHLKLPGNAPIALYSGHLFPFKGVDFILECAADLPDIQFIIVGGSTDEVRKCSTKSSHLRNVHFTGFVPHGKISEYLAAADFFLLPNLSSTPLSNRTPLKIFEYCAARRPIIASGLKEFKEYLKHEHTAFLFEPDNPSSFKAAIRKSIENPNLSAKIIEQAYELAQQHSWTKRAEAILTYYAPELLTHERLKH